jgi:hypothetical protein
VKIRLIIERKDDRTRSEFEKMKRILFPRTSRRASRIPQAVTNRATRIHADSGPRVKKEDLPENGNE